jgi:hypothetical protein
MGMKDVRGRAKRERESQRKGPARQDEKRGPHSLLEIPALNGGSRPRQKPSIKSPQFDAPILSDVITN